MKMSELPLPQGVELHDGPSQEQTAEALADDVAKVLRRRLEHARNATLVVSGGSTPVPTARTFLRAGPVVSDNIHYQRFCLLYFT